MSDSSSPLSRTDQSLPIWPGADESTEFARLAGIELSPPPHGALSTEVVVVGAGITGLSVAYELAQRGVEVLVLEAGPTLAFGETRRSSAHLSSAIDDRYYEIERLHGAQGARLAARSHQKAIDRIAQICERESIEAGFRYLEGYLIAEDPGPAGLAELERECEAARTAGLEVTMVPDHPYEGLGSVPLGPALRFSRQGRIDPVAYVHGLARAAQATGRVRLHVDTRVIGVKGGARPEVHTAQKARISARAVVVATNSPVHNRVRLHTQQAPYRTYMVTLEAGSVRLPDALLWDTGERYHYVRLIDPGEGQQPLLLVGGCDHKTGQGQVDSQGRITDFYTPLEHWARERFKGLGQVVRRWSGQVLEPVDYFPFMGPSPGDENVYLSSGDSGHGITHGAMAGMVLADLIEGRPNVYATLYDPSRVPLSGAQAVSEFVGENLNVAAQYLDLVKGGQVASPGEIAPGSGALVGYGPFKRAWYRDERGQLHGHSALCPHLGGVVHFNPDEQSWDCPVHGSRFCARTGNVIAGPACQPLAAAD